MLKRLSMVLVWTIVVGTLVLTGCQSNQQDSATQSIEAAQTTPPAQEQDKPRDLPPAPSTGESQTELEKQPDESDTSTPAQGQDKPAQTQEPADIEKAGHNKDGKVAFLTFDDGPNAHTEALLDVLKEHNVKATFFMMEPSMKRYPELVQRMVDEGHAVGTHGITHDAKKVYKSADSVVNEMKQGLSTLEEITGVRSKLIRVPYGSNPHMKPSYMKAIEREGMLMWDWHIDSQDWRHRNATMTTITKKAVQELLKSKSDVDPVLLFHDKRATVEQMSVLIPYLKKKGYDLDILTEDMEPYQFKQ